MVGIADVVCPVLLEPLFVFFEDRPEAALDHLLVDDAAVVWMLVELGVGTRKAMGVVGQLMGNDRRNDVVGNRLIFKVACNRNDAAPLRAAVVVRHRFSPPFD